MCKHILNAQASIRAPCCQRFYDCPQCHMETQDHPLRKMTELILICKKCKKAFRKDLATFEQSDEYCPHCDNHYVVDAKTPTAVLQVESEDIRKDSRMIKDDRLRYDPRKAFFEKRKEKQESERVDQGGWIQAVHDQKSGNLGPDGIPFTSAFNDDELDWS